MIVAALEKSEQEIFDAVSEHLMKQGEASTGVSYYSNQSCVYRGVNGLKCAWGAMLTDVEFEYALRQHSQANTMSWNCLREYFENGNNHYKFVGQLQDCHDSHNHLKGDVFRAYVKKDMLELAADLNLNTDYLLNVYSIYTTLGA